MGYILFDTSDDIVSRQNAAWFFAHCRDLQHRLRPLDFSLHLYALPAVHVPHTEPPHYIVVVLVYIEGLHSPVRRELSFYTRPRFAEALRRTIDEAFHQSHMVNLAIGDPSQE